MNNETLNSVLIGLVRQALISLGTILVGYGLLNEEQLLPVAAGIATVIVSAVSLIISKYRADKKVDVALELPKGASRNELMEKLKEG